MYHKLQLCFVCHACHTPFTYGKRLLKIKKFENTWLCHIVGLALVVGKADNKYSGTEWRKMKNLLYLDHCLLEEEEEEDDDDDDLGVFCLKIMAENA